VAADRVIQAAYQDEKRAARVLAEAKNQITFALEHPKGF